MLAGVPPLLDLARGVRRSMISKAFSRKRAVCCLKRTVCAEARGGASPRASWRAVWSLVRGDARRSLDLWMEPRPLDDAMAARSCQIGAGIVRMTLQRMGGRARTTPSQASIISVPEPSNAL
jgi:hypothetical protein